MLLVSPAATPRDTGPPHELAYEATTEGARTAVHAIIALLLVGVDATHVLHGWAQLPTQTPEQLRANLYMLAWRCAERLLGAAGEGGYVVSISAPANTALPTVEVTLACPPPLDSKAPNRSWP